MLRNQHQTLDPPSNSPNKWIIAFLKDFGSTYFSPETTAYEAKWVAGDPITGYRQGQVLIIGFRWWCFPCLLPWLPCMLLAGMRFLFLALARISLHFALSLLLFNNFLLMDWFRLWQDAESRVYLINELDKRTGQVNIICYSSFCHMFFSLFFTDLELSICWIKIERRLRKGRRGKENVGFALKPTIFLHLCLIIIWTLYGCDYQFYS